MRYDFFSYFYDRTLEALYRPARTRAVAALQVTPGSTVLDVACGTGQNFNPLMTYIGEGEVIGVDQSKGMLKHAEDRVEKAGWTNVHLVESDIHAFGAAQLKAACGRPEADFIICALGFTVIPDWEQAFQNCYDLLREGGRFAVFDVHAEKRTLQTRSVEWMSGADLKRHVWKPLEKVSSDFEMTYLPGSPWVFGGRLFVATGTRN